MYSKYSFAMKEMAIDFYTIIFLYNRLNLYAFLESLLNNNILSNQGANYH